MSTPGEHLRQIPSVDLLLQRPALLGLAREYSRELVVSAVQRELDDLRQGFLQGDLSGADLELRIGQLEERIAARLKRRFRASLRPLINATGILLHTNAGRAPMGAGVVEAMARLATSYSNLEYDLENGRRGHRDIHFEARAARLLGCEAATVCNNAAAALILMLNTFARGRKVLVSRGELIEIGGSFRLPAILESSGAVLKEVGTTNKTRLSDYRDALEEDVAAILRVHPSNYKIIGFTHRPGSHELGALAREKNILLFEDAGSGLLFADHWPFLKDEPAISSLLEAGADLICFSGDKLLGGPQAGILIGRKRLIQTLRRNPLMRAFRVDKLTYAALEWTLMQYETGDYRHTLPIYRMLSESQEDVSARVRSVAGRLDRDFFQTKLEEGHSLMGGGSAPEEPIPTLLLLVRPRSHGSANWLETRLRAQEPPVLSRIEKDWVVLDLRTVFPAEEELLVSAFASIAAQAAQEKNRSDADPG